MIKKDNAYFLDFTSELSVFIASLEYFKVSATIEKKLLKIYQEYLKMSKKIEFASPCIVELSSDSSLISFIEGLKNLQLIDDTDPFILRQNNYFILCYPKKKHTHLR